MTDGRRERERRQGVRGRHRLADWLASCACNKIPAHYNESSGYNSNKTCSCCTHTHTRIHAHTERWTHMETRYHLCTTVDCIIVISRWQSRESHSHCLCLLLLLLLRRSSELAPKLVVPLPLLLPQPESSQRLKCQDNDALCKSQKSLPTMLVCHILWRKDSPLSLQQPFSLPITNVTCISGLCIQPGKSRRRKEQRGWGQADKGRKASWLVVVITNCSLYLDICRV